MAKTGFNTKFYFDKKAVIDAVGKAEAKVMGRKGALVRTIMRRSMKKKKGHAPEGQPPYSHQGNLKKVEFAFDRKTHTVVVGPVKLGNSNAAEVLDKGPEARNGGVVNVRGILNHRGEFIPLYVMSIKGRLGAIRSGKVVIRKAKVAARPFSAPALKEAKPYLAKEWKGRVKK